VISTDIWHKCCIYRVAVVCVNLCLARRTFNLFQRVLISILLCGFETFSEKKNDLYVGRVWKC
jgi:hypothetical protein